MSIILAIFYLFTGFAKYLGGSKISCGAHKLTRTPQIKKKKKKKKDGVGYCIKPDPFIKK